MRSHQRSDAFYLLAFFLAVIGLGTLLLLIPGVWTGPGPLAPVDALFTAASAVCVTGLITVDTARFSPFGQGVVLALIQVGGLGIISFTSLLLTVPGRRLPFRRLSTIRSFFVDGVEHDPFKIVRSIVFFTFVIELAGAFLLAALFRAAGVERWVFAGLFHSVSAFCNAGFSIFSDNLEGYAQKPALLAVVMVLVVSGGLGFIVLQDLSGRLRGTRRRLSYHSRVVLGMTAFLLAAGAAAFFLLELPRALASFDGPGAAVNALFQSVVTRTAGFNTVPQGELSQPSRILTLLFMLVGGAPGSIAGGIKVTTAFVVLAVMLRRPDRGGDLRVFRHRLSAKTQNDGIVYFLKAVALLLASVLALSLTEGLRGADFGDIVFEVFSAFGTVGLSTGLTGDLSILGKLVIVATMFAGRVGLIALAFPGGEKEGLELSYPEGTILLG